ncbi:EF-hand [Bimuria novae-zelandiae CBS 107.79]|uniref:Calmodulin n=1 Tax=Bimuria novae-zelandiae CBS 107.79 TaxID=1447943 RepID=A0A6A5VBM7_9PLEO|nr:EF-hand [Bimuria novae-zelandiae CBS 107.79]
MPPKRRAPPRRQAAPKPRSKLAKDHGLSADQEAEIREAFKLFAVKRPDVEYADSDEGDLRREDVRRSSISLNIAPAKSDLPEVLEILDPTESGFAPFENFLSYAAIVFQDTAESGGDNDDNDDEEEEEEYEEDRNNESNPEEVRAAFRLFTHGGSGPITLAHLRRVAKELKEDVPDDVLKDMIREANGGVKGKDVGGVEEEEFESVLRRAGVSFG